MSRIIIPEYDLTIDTELGRDASVEDIEKQLEHTGRYSYCEHYHFTDEDYICIARKGCVFTEETLHILYESHSNGAMKQIRKDKADKFGHTYIIWKRPLIQKPSWMFRGGWLK